MRLQGRVSLYEARGDFQLIGEFMEPDGSGLLQARFEALRNRLRDEGLFDQERKQAIPPRIAHIAVITSPTGAALQDILTVLRRRDPLLRVTVLPVAVQGDEAAGQIAAALRRANTLAEEDWDFDAVLLARGGGSLEDLWAFNEERVARAIAASRLPVISAIGHEVDITIADFAADLRAATPSAAAELISQDRSQLLELLYNRRERLIRSMRRHLQHTARELGHRRQRLRHPGARLREQAQRLDERELRLRELARAQMYRRQQRLNTLQLRLLRHAPQGQIAALTQRLQMQEQALCHCVAQGLQSRQQGLRQRADALRALDPQAVLKRGYAVISDTGGGILRDAASAQPGQRLRAQLFRGSLDLRVLEDEPASDSGC